METGKCLCGVVLASSLFLAACTTSGATNSTVDATTGDPFSETTATPGSNNPADCPESGDPVAWADEIRVEAEVVQEQSGDTPGVDLVMYPHPDYDGKPWSQWGQGIVAGNGKHYSALGDHHGADGNSFVYEYDPETSTLTQIVDVLATVPHQPGAWGFGKIHSQMVMGACGDIYFSTYWGSRRGLAFENGYEGDLLLRIDPDDRSTENLGVLLAEHGTASMAATPDGRLIYAEAADPFGQKVGSFVVIDGTSGETVFTDESDAHSGYRNVAVGADGTAFISWDETGLARYVPGADSIEVLASVLPGSVLRASTRPDDDGRIYAVTRDPPVFFSIDPDGTVTELGGALGYTASMALAPDGEHFYYIPGAHGAAWEMGTPLIAVDTETGEGEVVVELNPLVEERYGLVAGGTYSIVVSDDGKTIFVGLNAGDPATRDTFGEIILAVVSLP